MSEDYVPLGWPTELELSAIAAGTDTGWVFSLLLKHPPKQIRSMYGDWRHPRPAPAAEPYYLIPSKFTDEWPLKRLNKVFPNREWICNLQVLVGAVAQKRKLAIFTVKFGAFNNKIYEGIFDVEDNGGQNGLRQLLTQFANTVGAGP